MPPIKAGTVVVDVEPDFTDMNRRVGSEFRKAGQDAGRGFSSAFKSVAKGAGVAAAAGIGAVALEFKRAVGAAIESERVTKQTSAVLKSTGGVAGVTAGQVGKLADAISRKTGVDDEAIASAENLLLTFTNVRNEAGKGNDVFNQATQTITDMSVALGQDMKSSSIQLGKALNDPIKGITALGRVGVSFTEDQKEQIKTLVKSGKTLDAQKIILRELNKEFGGSAEAQAQPFDKLKNAVGNVEEAIGAGLKPALDGIANDLTGFAQKHLPAFERAGDDVAAVFKRTDIGLGEKLKLSSEEVRENLGPTIESLRSEFRNARLGDRLGQAIEDGIPVMVDAAAAAAPRAAGAFVNAFKNAGPWGQLLTVAFLANKLGAFGWAGSKASGLFVSSLSKAVGGPLKRAFQRSGETAAANAAESFASQIGPSVTSRRDRIDGPIGRRGRGAGRAFAAGMSATALAGIVGIGTAIAIKLNEEFTTKLDELFGGGKNSRSGRERGHDSLRPGPFDKDGPLRKFLGLNAGGPVPGVGTTDTVPAMLTPGEYVMTRQTVDKFGLGFMDALNQGDGLRLAPGQIPRFAQGGQVPAFAGTAGLVIEHQEVVLQTPSGDVPDPRAAATLLVRELRARGRG